MIEEVVLPQLKGLVLLAKCHDEMWYESFQECCGDGLAEIEDMVEVCYRKPKEAALAARNGGPPMAVMGSANRPGSAAPPRPAKSDFGPPPRPISAKPKLGRPVQGKALAKAGIAAPPPELARQPLGVNSPRK